MTKTTKPAPLYTVERYEREETTDYGRAGEIEWRLVYRGEECLEIYALRRDAKAHADRCNAALEA